MADNTDLIELNDLDPKTSLDATDNILISDADSDEYKAALSDVKTFMNDGMATAAQVAEDISATKTELETEIATKQDAGNYAEKADSMTSGKFVKWNGETLETSDESIATIDDTTVSTTAASSSKKVYDAVNTIVVSGGNVATTTHELTATLQGVTELYNGLTVRLLITSALQSSSAITQVNLNINSLGAIPIKAGRGNALVNLASHQMTAGASYNSSYPYRVCDAYTTLELVYCDGAFIVLGDAVVMSYTSTTEGYTVKANGLIKQWGTVAKGSNLSDGNDWKSVITFKIAYSNTYYNIEAITETTSAGEETSLYARANENMTLRLYNRNSSTSIVTPIFNWKAEGY